MGILVEFFCKAKSPPGWEYITAERSYVTFAVCRRRKLFLSAEKGEE